MLTVDAAAGFSSALGEKKKKRKSNGSGGDKIFTLGLLALPLSLIKKKRDA